MCYNTNDNVVACKGNSLALTVAMYSKHNQLSAGVLRQTDCFTKYKYHIVPNRRPPLFLDVKQSINVYLTDAKMQQN